MDKMMAGIGILLILNKIFNYTYCENVYFGM